MKQTLITSLLLGLSCKYLQMGFFLPELLIGCLCHRLSDLNFLSSKIKKTVKEELLVGAFLRDTWGRPLSTLFLLFCLLYKNNPLTFVMKAYF